MKTYRICIAVMAMLAGAVSADANQYSGEKIVMTCRTDRTPYMADVVYAVNHSHFSATPGARREMLTLTRQYCASGWKKIAFVPPADKR